LTRLLFPSMPLPTLVRLTPPLKMTDNNDKDNDDYDGNSDSDNNDNNNDDNNEDDEG
jgi:hypothetical protein